MDIVEDLRTTDRSSNPEFFQKAADEIERLRDALRKVAQSHAWQIFGECRSFGDGPLLTPAEADALAKTVLPPNA